MENPNYASKIFQHGVMEYFDCFTMCPDNCQKWEKKIMLPMCLNGSKSMRHWVRVWTVWNLIAGRLHGILAPSFPHLPGCLPGATYEAGDGKIPQEGNMMWLLLVPMLMRQKSVSDSHFLIDGTTEQLASHKHQSPAQGSRSDMENLCEQ